MSKFTIRIILSSIAPLIMVLIFYLSSIPKLILPDVGFSFFDKLIHLVSYFFLGIAINIFLVLNYGNQSLKINLNFAFLIGALFGLSDEYHQSFVPGRYSEIGDIIADIIGIFLSLFTYKFISKKLRKYAR